jgi:hypothetical protein
MDETAINDAINDQIAALISTPEGLASLAWYQELDEKAQGMIRTVLYAGLPAYYNEQVEETMVLLIGLVTGYELLLRGAGLLLDAGPEPAPALDAE